MWTYEVIVRQILMTARLAQSAKKHIAALSADTKFWPDTLISPKTRKSQNNN